MSLVAVPVHSSIKTRLHPFASFFSFILYQTIFKKSPVLSDSIVIHVFRLSTLYTPHKPLEIFQLPKLHTLKMQSTIAFATVLAAVSTVATAASNTTAKPNITATGTVTPANGAVAGYSANYAVGCVAALGAISLLL